MKNKKLYLVGKTINIQSTWEFNGIFDSLQLARKACLAKNYFIGVCELNEVIDKTPNDPPKQWPQYEYPLLKKVLKS
jgi:hypothetical protein